MYEQTQTNSQARAQLAQDTRALLAATAHVAGSHLTEARERLSAALDSGKELFEHTKDKAAQGVHAADVVVRKHPYQTILVALGLGVIVGFLATRR